MSRESGETIFTFGKHKGRSFKDVAASDAGYCAWAMKMENPSGALRDFVQFLQPGSVSQAQLPDAKLNSKLSGIFFLCEAVEDRFLVRAEMEKGGTAHLPAHVWQRLGSLPDAKMGADRRSWSYPMSSYQALVPMLEEMAAVEPIPQWVLAMLRQARRHGDEVQEARLPCGLMEYQREGVTFGMQRKGRMLLADDMGLGKTLQALALAAQYKEEWPVLVVCPSSLRWVWQEQALTWLADTLRPSEVQVIQKGSEQFCSKSQIFIISYNLLANGAKFQRRPDGQPHGIVIADESHNIKDWSAARTKALVPVLRHASRALLLSGTPTRNAPDELHPQLAGLLPDFHVRMADFRKRYCVTQVQNFRGNQVKRVVGARCAAELNFLLSSTCMVRRLKQDVLKQLPAKRRQRVPIYVPRKLKDVWADEVDELNSSESANLFKKIAEAKLAAVKEYISEVLDRVNEKVILFAHHHNVMDEITGVLGKHLPKAGYVRIDGTTPQSKRPELVRRFQEDPECSVALLSITSCGEGITMSAASLVIFVELYWVPGAIEQAEARAHRLGSTHSKVVVEFLVLANSADEYIYNRLERKKMDTSYVLDGAPESLKCSDRGRGDRLASPEPKPKRARVGSAEPAEKPETPSPVDRHQVLALLKAVAKGREALLKSGG